MHQINQHNNEQAVKKEDILKWIPKTNSSFKLIESLLSTPTNLQEILNYNPIIISVLVDQPYKRELLTIIYKLLFIVHFTSSHFKILRTNINFVCDEEYFIKIGFFIKPPNFLKKLSKSTLDFLTIEEIYKFKEFIYLAKNNAIFYKKIYVHKLFKNERLRILQLVKDKNEIVSLKNYTLEQADYLYSIRKELSTKNILQIVEYKIKKGIISKYKYKMRYLLIVFKKLEEKYFNPKISKENISKNLPYKFKNKNVQEWIRYFIIKTKRYEVDTQYFTVLKGNEILRKYFLYQVKDEIDSFIVENIENIENLTYILDFIRYTKRFEYLLKLLRGTECENIKSLIKEIDIVNEEIAKEACKITENKKLILYIIRCQYDVLEELYNNDLFLQFINSFDANILVKHTDLIFVRKDVYENEKIFKELINKLHKELPEKDRVFLYILKYMNNNHQDYLYDICPLFFDDTKYMSFYVHICLKYNKIPYGIMKYKINRDKIMLNFIYDKKLFLEYIKYEINPKVLFKILNKLQNKKNTTSLVPEDVYRVLIDLNLDNKKLINILKGKLKGLKYLIDTGEISCLLNLLIEYKNKKIIKGILREIIECIELDKHLNFIIKDLLLISLD